MRYSLESGGHWDDSFSDKETADSVLIVFKDKDLEDNAKLERQEYRADKITA